MEPFGFQFDCVVLVVIPILGLKILLGYGLCCGVIQPRDFVSSGRKG